MCANRFYTNIEEQKDAISGYLIIDLEDGNNMTFMMTFDLVIKNNSLGMFLWEQMAFPGNPDCAIEFTSIYNAKFAETRSGKGYHIDDPDKLKSAI